MGGVGLCRIHRSTKVKISRRIEQNNTSASGVHQIMSANVRVNRIVPTVSKPIVALKQNNLIHLACVRKQPPQNLIGVNHHPGQWQKNNLVPTQTKTVTESQMRVCVYKGQHLFGLVNAAYARGSIVPSYKRVGPPKCFLPKCQMLRPLQSPTAKSYRLERMAKIQPAESNSSASLMQGSSRIRQWNRQAFGKSEKCQLPQPGQPV